MECLGLLLGLQEAYHFPEVCLWIYDKPITAVYRDATREAIKEAQNLRILGAAENRPRARSIKSILDSNSPSWVPRWDLIADSVELSFQLPAACRADSGLPMELEDHPDADCLRVTGIDVGRVVAVSPIARDSTMSDYKAFLQRQSHLTQRNAIGSLNRSISEYHGLHLSPKYGTATFGWGFPAIAHGIDISNDGAANSSAAEFTAALSFALFSRRLFITDKGRVGIGPMRMKVHDRITILFGSSLPAVLRSEGLAYGFVGYSFITGMMNGEMTTKQKAKGGSCSEFDIY